MSSGVKVAVRVRPFNGREMDRNAECIVKMNGNKTVLIRPSNLRANPNAPPTAEDEKSFTFDHSYWSFDNADPNYATQGIVFDDLGREVLQNAWEGYNSSIFAYGQTGSGKSYSMLGYGEEKGIIPLVCEEMFNRIGNTQSTPTEQTVFKVEVSFMEIYNERVKDLLNPKNNKPGGLKVRNNPTTGPYVEDLSKLAVKSFQEIEMLMDEGSKARTVASTNMNATSSRSHAVFTIVFTQTKIDRIRGVAVDRVSKVSLVDLAGSERAASTGATGMRLKEGANINKSLSTLGKVISALAENSSNPHKKPTFVPFRDSVLTYLLKESLGGNSKTIMIAAISPADINYDETLSTLRYADSAKKIKTTATINEDAQSKVIRELQTEVERLKALLSAGGLTAVDQAKLMGVGSDEVMSLNEKIEQYEKLMAEMNKSWEERLQESEKIREERMSSLRDTGVAIKVVSSIPHLINLNDDPLMSESLLYYLKEGETKIGRSDAEATQDIVLNGLGIAKEHCIIESRNGIVTIIPVLEETRPHSSIFVNGVEISAPTVLTTGNRVILGNNHIFRFNNPEEAAKLARERGATQQGSKQNKSDQIIDYDFALNELASVQGNLSMNRQLDESREFQKQLSQLRTQLEMDFTPEKRERRDNLAILALRRWRSKVYRSRLLNQISHLILSLNEANAISDTLTKNVDFSLKLSAVYLLPEQLNATDEVEVDWRMTQISIKVIKKDTGEDTIISVEDFIDRVYSMRELYQNDGKLDSELGDPFKFNFNESSLIGVSHVYLKNLLYFIEIKKPIPILDTNGSLKGFLNVVITPKSDEITQEDQPSLLEEGSFALIGKHMTITAQLTSISDFKDKYVDVYSKFTFNSESYQSNVSTTIQSFKDEKKISIQNVTDEMVNFFETHYLAIELWGKRTSQLDKSLEIPESLKKPIIESYDFMASLNILEPEQPAPDQSPAFKPVHILEESDTANNLPSVTFRLKKQLTHRQIVLKLFNPVGVNMPITIKECKSVKISNPRVIGKREAPTGVLPLLGSGTPSTPSTPGGGSRNTAPPSTPITPFSSSSFTNNTPSGTPVSYNTGSNGSATNLFGTPTSGASLAGRVTDPNYAVYELPVIASSDDTIIVSWDNSDPSYLLNLKTRKGSRIIFKITFVLNVLDFPGDITLQKDLSVKILSSDSFITLPDSANTSMSNLLDRFKTHFKSESILHDKESSMLHSGSVFNVHCTKSHQLEHQNKIGDMIDRHHENIFKLGYAMRIEKLRQELDLRQKLCTIRDRMPSTDDDEGGDHVDRILAEEVVRKISQMNNITTPETSKTGGQRKALTTTVIDVKVNEISSGALIKEDELRGYLKKKSTYKDEWKPRFFVWKKPFLYYSHNEKDYALKNKKIDLTNTTIVTIPQEELAFGFAIIQLRRVWLLQASSNEQREKWLQILDPTRKVSELKAQELSDAKQQNEVLKRENERLDAENRQLKSKYDQSEHKSLVLNGHVKGLQDFNDNKLVQIDDLTSTIANTTHLMDLISEQSRNFKNVTDMEIDTLRQETLSLRDTNSVIAQKLAEYRDMVVALENEKRQKDDKLEYYKQTIDTNSTITDFQSRNLQKMRDDTRTKQSQIEALTQTVESSSRRLQDITDQMSQTSLEAESQKDELAHRNDEISQINNAYQSESVKLKDQTSQLNTLSTLLRSQMKAFENTQGMQKEHSVNEQKKLLLLLQDLEGGLSKASQTITEQGNQNLTLRRELDEARSKAGKGGESTAQLETQLKQMKDRLITSENKLIDMQCDYQMLSDKQKMWEEEMKIKDAKLGLLENNVKEVRADFENGMAVSREFSSADTSKKLTSRKSMKMSPEELMENMRESSIAHQTHNAFLGLQMQRLETEMRQQEKVYKDTIQRLKQDLQQRNQQNITLMRQQGADEVVKKMQDSMSNYEMLKKKYFISLVVAAKLQNVLMGNPVNVDAYDMYDEAINEHVLEAEQWPNWVAERFRAIPQTNP
ncbi:hypothetical protein SAMD00019534_028380 [Acytostelium subglobosum LB1]|uniref:hypothetical protein n=1 Tax=Acytostelium subglobosum LB1 TaxID=1410327 RepID=UPI00064500F2|nr:hypothetical protein SAMD00019534_028380 [Acytostelium subglobosum LB1]GAM19663.1 hypothetical protein SAMD00019534_028380 [Acytostelium subglobosum LB1]|eukprot:XP_012756425.1 hypothetical protein SAMD00019534_028380 [Acytostelium subglobosum LB1]